MKIGITLPNSLIKQTDRLRGDVPRSTYIRRAIEYYLKQDNIRGRVLFWESQHIAAPVDSRSTIQSCEQLVNVYQVDLLQNGEINMECCSSNSSETS